MALEPINPIGTLKKPNGEYTQSAGGTLDLLLETHLPGGKRSNGLVDEGHAGSSLSPRAARIDWRLVIIIVKMSRKKGASNKFASNPVLKLICELFRASVALGHIPQAWRISRVVFIPKRGKTDYSQAKAFRPISLSSFSLKTIERLVERYLRDRVLNGQPLHRNQHAYQSGRSCITALNELVSRAEDSLMNKEIALCAFLDIEGAFDNTSHEVIVQKAINRGVPITLSNWIKNMLQTRRVQSSLLNETREISTVKGCPQGGVLSPLLWNLVVDDLLVEISQTGTYIQGYADDIALVVQGKFVDTVVDVMNRSLRQVGGWCRREGLAVNPSKTVILPITRKKNLNPLARLELDGVRLDVSDSVKYLGLTLDRWLSWGPHLDAAIRKANWSFLATRRFIGKTWGLKPHMALWLYKAVIRPQITYAALVWWTKTRQSTVKTRLSSLQRLACLSISGAFPSTPTAALQVLLNLTPLDVFIDMEARNSCYKLSIANSLRRGLSRTGHASALEMATNEPLISMRSDIMEVELMFIKPYTISIDSRQQWTTDKSMEVINNCTVWYTDGSLIEEKAGYGAHRIKPRCNLSGSLGRFCTVFQAEIFTILACVQAELTAGTKNRRILIFSDSQAALKALDCVPYTSKLVWECAQALRVLSSLNNTELVWIPGHKGFQGNEKADLLARKGALSSFAGPEPAVGVSPSLVKARLKALATSKHTENWEQFPGQSLARSLIKSPSRTFTNSIIGLNRKDIRLTFSYLTGHGHFRNHLEKMGLYTGDTICRLCQRSTETAKHILLECDSLEARRRRLLGGLEWQDIHLSELGGTILKLCKPSGVGLPD